MSTHNEQQAAARQERLDNYLARLTLTQKDNITTTKAAQVIGVSDNLAKQVLMHGIEKGVMTRESQSGPQGGRHFVYAVVGERRKVGKVSPVDRFLYGVRAAA